MSSVEPLHALNLDKNQQQTFVRYFNGLPEKPSTLIRVFNRTDYYTLHGDDAHFAAKELFKSTAQIKTMATAPKLDYLVLSKNNFERFVRKLLLVKQFQVEVLINRGTGKNLDWQIEFKGSPGNLSQFEELLFENNNEIVVNSCVMAIKLDKNQLLGVSYINVDERIFSICEFTDNDFFSQLESLIIQMSPRECLIEGNDLQSSSRLKTILNRSNFLCTVQKKMEFNENVVADLNRLLHFEKGQQQSCNSLPEMNLKTAMASLHAAIVYLELTADTDLHGKFKTQILDTKRYVHLDHAAVKALNILPKEGASANERKNTSIIGLLDCCRTVHGRRTLAQWIKQPLKDLNTLTDRLDLVEAFVNDPSLRYNIYNEHLRRVPDLLMLSKKLLKKKVRLQDVYRIYQTIDKLPHMVSALATANHKTINTYFVDPLNGFLEDMQKYQTMIETTLDMDLVDKGEFLVKPSFDDDLQELYERKQKLEEKVQKQFNTAARDLSMEAGKIIKLEYNDQYGYFLRVTLKEEPALRKNKNYEILGAVKGGVRFTNTKIQDLNSDYTDIKRSYETQQKNVVNEILNIAAGYSDTLASINFVISQLDVLVAFANVSCSAPTQYIRPKLFEQGTGHLKLTQVRHPCLEIQDGVSFNPNDIEFDQNTVTFHIITGPNMGGKSTYIRSVGVAVLMAQIGCFVPCDEAEISLVDCILARVGSEDCQSKGLSTFMLEMVETAGILRTATKDSLVIIDELGRGTSTYEGCGIAWAIAEHLAKEIKSFSMFATHFHEITKLADDVPTVVNKHVTAMVTENDLTLMYQVKPGFCDQSFGIHVAKMAGFPAEFIEYATRIQNNLEDYRNIDVLQKLKADERISMLENGDELIANMIKKCHNLNLKRLSDDEINTDIKRMKQELKSSNNPYILALLGE